MSAIGEPDVTHRVRHHDGEVEAARAGRCARDSARRHVQGQTIRQRAGGDRECVGEHPAAGPRGRRVSHAHLAEAGRARHRQRRRVLRDPDRAVHRSRVARRVLDGNSVVERPVHRGRARDRTATGDGDSSRQARCREGVGSTRAAAANHRDRRDSRTLHRADDHASGRRRRIHRYRTIHRARVARLILNRNRVAECSAHRRRARNQAATGDGDPSRQTRGREGVRSTRPAAARHRHRRDSHTLHRADDHASG